MSNENILDLGRGFDFEVKLHFRATVFNTVRPIC